MITASSPGIREKLIEVVVGGSRGSRAVPGGEVRGPPAVPREHAPELRPLRLGHGGGELVVGDPPGGDYGEVDGIVAPDSDAGEAGRSRARRGRADRSPDERCILNGPGAVGAGATAAALRVRTVKGGGGFGRLRPETVGRAGRPVKRSRRGCERALEWPDPRAKPAAGRSPAQKEKFRDGRRQPLLRRHRAGSHPLRREPRSGPGPVRGSRGVGCSRTGARGLAPFGTTGEALSLGLAERRRLLDALLEAGIDPAGLMPGTGLCSIPDTVELCRHAVEAGCGGVMVLPPFYFKGVSDDGVVRALFRGHRSDRDARLRIYLYHIPPQAVIGFPSSCGAPHRCVPGRRGGAQGQLRRLVLHRALLAAYPDSGSSRARRPSFSTTFAMAAALHHRDRQRQRPAHPGASTTPGGPATTDADELQAEISALRACIQAKPVIPAKKHLVAHYRDDPGWAAVRPPFRTLATADGRRAPAGARAGPRIRPPLSPRAAAARVA